MLVHSNFVTEEPNGPMECGKRDALCAALEREFVHDVYNKTAHHFQDIRYKAWPRVREFLLDLPPGSLVGDIGCGSGKYLNISKSIVAIGCDHSNSLLQVAGQQNHQVLSCDNLQLPMRDGCFDAVISIGVIHHFTTPSRRARAIQEVSRVLRPGGTAMIYVWAMEQKHRTFKSQDVLVPWHLKPKHSKPVKPVSENRTSQTFQDDIPSPSRMLLPVIPNSSQMPNCPYLYGGNIDATRSISGTCRSGNSTLRNSYIKPKSQPGSENTTADQYKKGNSNSEFRYMLKNHFRILKKKGTSPVAVEATPMFAPYQLNAEAEVLYPKQHLQNESGATKHSVDQSPNDKVKLSGVLKAKMLRLIGRKSRVTETIPASSQREKDQVYKQLLDDIVREDSELFTRATGDNIVPSVLALEGFAVREFPASSRSASVEDEHDDGVAEGPRGHSTGPQTHVSSPHTKSSMLQPPNETSPVCAAPVQNGVSRTIQASDIKHSSDKGMTQVPANGLGTDAGSDYKQKCADWLQQSVVYNVQRPNSLPLSNGTATRDIQQHDVCHPNDDRSESADQATVRSPDWAKVTSQLIKTMQTQVEHITRYTYPTKTDTTPCYNGQNVGGKDTSHCTCKNKTSSAVTVETSKYEKNDVAKSSDRRRNRSESSLSSFSSVSSDTDSVLSDIEEMSVCVACRGDSVEYGVAVDVASTPAATTKLSAGDPMEVQFAGTTDRLTLNSDRRHVQDGCADVHPAQIKHQPTTLRSSHDSGYCELGMTLTQDSLDVTKVKSAQPVSELHPSVTNDRTERGQGASESDSYKRFYHVFKEGELVSLIERRVKNLQVVDSFYDHANWCVIVQKTEH